MFAKPKYIIFFYLILALTTILLTINKSYSADLQMSLPIECEYGKNCFIQNYVDVDSKNNQHTDYKCGFLSYDSHKGTDFRLLDFKELSKGYKVLAVADGIVEALRTDEPDFAYIEKKYELIKDKECGNGIIIKHSNGFSTQYCHMLKDSIIVKQHQTVKSGQVLGYVGMSGKTEFPHVHIGVKKSEKVVDPFLGTNPIDNYTCNKQSTLNNSLWNDDTLKQLRYIDTAILSFHATSKVPTKFLARLGKYREQEISRKANNIVIWADIMGIKKDDQVIFELIDNKGNKIIDSKQDTPKKYVLYFLYAGKKLTRSDLETGNYTAKVSINRNNQVIAYQEKILKII